jgi:phospholipase/lecithinase/hemolysin
LNWLGYLITEFNASTTFSYNLAVGGATTDSVLIPPYSNTVKSFVDQVDELRLEFASNPPWVSENLLVGVWIGNNDVGNSFAQDNKNSLYLQISAKYVQQLQKLHEIGARNFVILSAGRKFYFRHVCFQESQLTFLSQRNTGRHL